MDGSKRRRKDNYETVKQMLTSKLTPASLVTSDEFHRRKLLPGEASSIFVRHLKKLLLQAMPKLDATTRDQLLLHQFVAGLPQAVSWQLRATGEAKDLAAMMERARLLISLDDHRRQSAGGRHCFICNRQGHLARECQQGNGHWAPVRGSRHPQPPQ